MSTKKIYELVYDETLLGVFAISLVEEPAIEVDFQYFNSVKPLYFVKDEEKRIVFGLIMIPNKPILREPRPDLGIDDYHYITFSKETIEMLMQNYLKKGFNNNVSLGHRDVAEGIEMMESFTTNENVIVKGYEDFPSGCWFGKYKIKNEQIWEEIKKGTFKGFSIEAELIYDFEKKDTDIEYLENLYNKLIKLK